MKGRLHTFDIWDTCLVRATGTPRSIFRAAARQSQPAASSGQIETLVQQRVSAELAARQTADHGECTLAEIESALAEATSEEQARGFIAAELELERASARPVLETLAVVQRARESGAIVAFASDMYLPETFLRELLEAHGFAQPGDHVFVSGNRRANKHSGRLFQVMRRELAKDGVEWTHHGDNPHADIAAAKSQGIRATEHRAADWTAAEQLVLERASSHSERIAAAMRAVRLGVDPSISAVRREFFSGVAAPWLVALTTRSLKLARELGAQRIYFVARDGDIPLRIARIVAPEGVDCRYLPGSRKAWCYPAMFDLSEECTSWLRFAPMRPETLLASLGLSAEERSAMIDRSGLGGGPDRRRTHDELQPLWTQLQSGEQGRVILCRAAAARETCLAFLRDEGLFDDVPWALADVGWSLHAQAALKRMLKGSGAPQTPQGVYFMMRPDRRPESETGPARAWIVGGEGGSNDSTGDLLAWMSPVIEECLLTSADASVSGYSRNGERVTPTLSSSAPSPETARHAAELRLHAEALARELAADLSDDAFSAAVEDSALEGLLRFLREPTGLEVEVLRGLRHATAPGAPSRESQPLVRPYSVGDALALLLRRAGLRRSRPESEPYWHSGSMAVSPRLARAGMKAALAPNPLKRLLQGSG